MTAIAANGFPIISGTIHEPQRGPWTARIEVDDDLGAVFASGSVAITVGASTWIGVVTSGAVDNGKYVARVIGGAGGLRKSLDPRYYYQAPLGLVFTDICADALEAPDPVTVALLAGRLQARYSRPQGEARLGIKQLADQVGGFWRVSREGLIQILTSEVFVPIVTDADEVSRDESTGTITIATEEPLVRPGMTYASLEGAVNVVDVVTNFSARGIEQILTSEHPEGDPRGPAAIFAAQAKAASARAMDLTTVFSARAVLQHADGTIDLIPDDARIRGSGMTHVPLQTGAPGLKVTVTPGDRLCVWFQNGDASKPVAGLWDQPLIALEPLLRGQTFTSALSIWLGALATWQTELDFYVKIPTPTGPETAAYTAASLAFTTATTAFTTAIAASLSTLHKIV